MRWLLGFAIVAALTGCAGWGLDRADMDALIYADCVRSGGTWHGDNQFGGSCRYEGRWQ